jgi:hypothetical protein
VDLRMNVVRPRRSASRIDALKLGRGFQFFLSENRWWFQPKNGS